MVQGVVNISKKNGTLDKRYFSIVIMKNVCSSVLHKKFTFLRKNFHGNIGTEIVDQNYRRQFLKTSNAIDIIEY